MSSTFKKPYEVYTRRELDKIKEGKEKIIDQLRLYPDKRKFMSLLMISFTSNIDKNPDALHTYGYTLREKYPIVWNYIDNLHKESLINASLDNKFKLFNTISDKLRYNNESLLYVNL